MIELWDGDADAVVFLQTIEHVQDPDAVLDRLRTLVGPGGVAFVSTPNVLTLAPAGAERSGNPWHVREYRAEAFRALCAAHFGSVELLGLHHARRLRAHALALRLGWDRVHAALRITRPFYDRFTPAIVDARLRAAAATASSGRWTSWPCCGHEPRRAVDRPAHAHALRRGLRHLAAGRGAAVGGGRHELPAAARRARRRARPRDRLAHSGAGRPARGARRPGPLRGVPARGTARDAPARRGERRGRRGRGRAGAQRRALRRGRGRAGPPRPRPRRRVRAARGLDVGGDPSRAAAVGHRRRRAAPARDGRRRPPRPLRRVVGRAVAAGVRVRAVARRAARRGGRAGDLRRPDRRARPRRAGAAAAAAHGRRSAARADRPRGGRARVGRGGLPVAGRRTAPSTG